MRWSWQRTPSIREGNAIYVPLLWGGLRTRLRRSALRCIRNAAARRVDPMKETRSTCPYCGVGCGVIIESDGEQITGVRGDPDHPANLGRLCTRGSTLHLTAAAPVTRQARLLQPMRRDRRGGQPLAVSWDHALDFATETFAQVIREHGPD